MWKSVVFSCLCSISTRKQAGQPFMWEQKGVPTFNSLVGLRISQRNFCPVKWWPIVWSGYFFPCSPHSPGSIFLTFFSFELMACSSRLVTFFYVHLCQCCWHLVACGQVDAPIFPIFWRFIFTFSFGHGPCPMQASRNKQPQCQVVYKLHAFFRQAKALALNPDGFFWNWKPNSCSQKNNSQTNSQMPKVCKKVSMHMAWSAAFLFGLSA